MARQLEYTVTSNNNAIAAMKNNIYPSLLLLALAIVNNGFGQTTYAVES